MKQQELRAQQLKQQQLQAQEAEAQRKYASQQKYKSNSTSEIDAYGQTLGGLERAVMACSKYRENTPPWNDCIYRLVN